MALPAGTGDSGWLQAFHAVVMTEGGQGHFDPFETGCNPADPVDQAIMATRKAVFPRYGLMP